MDNEVAKARAAMAAKFGKAQLGGKGTQRRVMKSKPAKAAEASAEEKKIKAFIKKTGVQPLPDIEEVNMFKDDNTVVHFKRPVVHFSNRENLLSVVGSPDVKQMKDLLPEILKQVGPQQYGFLKDIIDQSGLGGKKPTAVADEDDVPPLVEGNFESAAKK